MLISISAGENACAQQSGTAANRDQAIATWIQHLSSGTFAERLAATQNLRKAGESAIRPLQAALTDADAEQKIRISSILKTLESNSFAGMLQRIQADPNSPLLETLPEWNRYSSIVGKSSADREFYIRLLQAEADLFTIASQDARSLRTPLRSRAAELLQDIREAVRTSQPIKMESYAALLLLAGNQDLLLRGDTSTSLNGVLLSPAFEEQLATENGHRYLKLAGAYIQRSNIAVVEPLRFARKFETADGLKLARRVLTSVLRGVDGQMALIVIKEQGDQSDLPLVEALLDHPGLLAQGRRTKANATQSYTATNGDLALAVAISLRKQDPRDYGFSRTDNVAKEFRFALDTIGFSSDDERKRSRQLYRNRWLAQSDQ